MTKMRIEKDSMGEMQVPEDVLYAAQTARAVANFPVSGVGFPRPFIRALGLIKKNAAAVNAELGLVDAEKGQAIQQAAQEVIDGKLDEHFVVDIYQTGSGTSTNMNTNEVVANRAKQIMGDTTGKAIHPNDHVNFGQSSNDVIPTASNISAAVEIKYSLIPALFDLQEALGEKAVAFDDIVKIGRTHLQDATPVRLGQVFSGYARQVALSIRRIESAKEGLKELPLGGTAVGTGINTHPEFSRRVVGRIADATDIEFREAVNHFEAQGARDALVQASGALKTCACSLYKIGNDIRFLGSGPRCGLGELKLPPVQPGSSIMPGKVNPVMVESLMQVCAQVIGNDAAVSVGGLSGNFELNVMIPVMIHNVLSSIRIMSNCVKQFTERCVRHLEADRETIGKLVEQSLMLATPLAPVIGYDQAAEVAKEAYKTGKTIRELVREKGILADDKLEEVLDIRAMTEPGINK
ncbi:MAG: class II fumarate hydratase [Deltaproteobacteria bacterium]|nr:class II fumarate hydratase [Deltaproteobacteria bacterium]